MFFHHHNHMDGVYSWTFHHTTKKWDGGRFPISARLEMAWRKKTAPAAYIKLGTTYSENPLQLHVSLWFVAFWLSISLAGLNGLIMKLTTGHKRKIGVTFHDGMMWWNLWYDNDAGWDTHHKCKYKSRPGKRYRGWACLRDGNLYLNPINNLWGMKYYSYKDVDHYTRLVRFTDVPNDEYLVDFKLQEMWRGRRRGPKWATDRTFEGFIVDWNCEKGIPTENNSYKGDCVYGSSLPIDPPPFGGPWIVQAETKLIEWIAIQRERYGYLHDGYDARKGGWKIDG